MIKRFIARLLGRTASVSPLTPKRIPSSTHGLTRAVISPCALKVTDTLQQHGYLAYVVGGAVRDLLLAKTPKDFDIATNATPEQVHALFRRSLLIGRRFRLVHVMCGQETIEVSTFRGGAKEDGASEQVPTVSVLPAHADLSKNTLPTVEDDSQTLSVPAEGSGVVVIDAHEHEVSVELAQTTTSDPDVVTQPRSARQRRSRRTQEYSQTHATDATGRVVRDNVFGDHASDAERRDFTVNALYFDPNTQEILDFRGGVADVRQRVLRIIGDPATRYREDPVRMLRAARFAAKLGFSIDASARAPIAELADLLKNVPPARLFDEMLKLLLSGHAVRAVQQLRDEGLHQGVLPMLDTILESESSTRFVMAALHNTDIRVQAGKPVSPAFLFASLLWHDVRSQHMSRCDAGEDVVPALYEAMNQVLEQHRAQLAIPRRLDGTMKEIWSMQPRFEQRSGTRASRLIGHPRFRAAYDFLLLRAEAGEIDATLAEWWTQFQVASDAEKDAMVAGLVLVPQKKRRKRSKKSQVVIDDVCVVEPVIHDA